MLASSNLRIALHGFAVCLLGHLSIGVLVGQEPGSKPALQVQAGFAGYWKLGHRCPLRIRLTGSLVSEARSIRAFSVDGDGVEVAYSRPVEAGSAGETWMPIRIGRKEHTIRIEVLGAADNILFSGQITPESSKVLPSDQPLVIALGDSMGLEKLSRTTADGSDSNFTCVTIRDPEDLPPKGEDLESCDLLVISTSDSEFVEGLLPRWGAVDEYVRRGGGCIFSASVNSIDLLSRAPEGDSPSIADFLPGKVLGKGKVSDPGVLESMLASERIDGFDMVRLEDAKGRVELSLSDSLNRSSPWWTSFSHGHGTVRVLASDLGNASFDRWKDHAMLWGIIVEPYLDEELIENRAAEDASGDFSYLGYNDLVGQLRATLDVFGAVRVVSFSQISAILVAVILLVGPLDYFLSVRWLKRPDLSWYFSFSVLVLVVAGLTYYCLQSRPAGILVNTVQILDYDLESGKRNGVLWSHVYC